MMPERVHVPEVTLERVVRVDAIGAGEGVHGIDGLHGRVDGMDGGQQGIGLGFERM